MIVFTTPKGEDVTGKVAFSEYALITIKRLNSMLNDDKTIYVNGEKYTYHFIQEPKKERKPRAKRWINRTKRVEIFKTFKSSGSMIMEYSKDRLIKTYDKDTFEQMINNLFWFVCPMYLK